MKLVKIAALLALSFVAVASQAAVDAAVTTAISTGVTNILEVIALGGAAFVTISGAGVIWNVASKFVKRLGGKA